MSDDRAFLPDGLNLDDIHGISEAVKQAVKYGMDPMSVTPEWRRFFEHCFQNRDASSGPRYHKVKYDPAIKLKDDEAFRLYLDDFYSVSDSQ